MDTIRIMIEEEKVDARIREIAAQINREYEGKEIHLIGVLKGSVFFVCELAKRLTVWQRKIQLRHCPDTKGSG